VRDQGAGIPPAFQPRVFQRFAQADGADTRQKGGTGLGLSISKSLVEEHGGQISFETAPGDGTVFHVDLPPP
jgi:signal transduction histidine kinase